MPATIRLAALPLPLADKNTHEPGPSRQQGRLIFTQDAHPGAVRETNRGPAMLAVTFMTLHRSADCAQEGDGHLIGATVTNGEGETLGVVTDVRPAQIGPVRGTLAELEVESLILLPWRNVIDVNAQDARSLQTQLLGSLTGDSGRRF